MKNKENQENINAEQEVRQDGEVQNDPTMNLDEATTQEAGIDDVAVDDTEEAEVVDLMKKYQETQEALDKKTKDYLYLMAEFDNYRKRTIKEKADIIKTASEKVLKDMLPIVDDFERGLEATKDTADGQEVRNGMELIYNKFVTFLHNNGVKAIESTGKEFDDNVHEAIATIPAPDEDSKGKVVDTITKGYTLNDKVIRHAKVVVGDK